MTEFEKHPLFREIVAILLADYEECQNEIIEKFGKEYCDIFAKGCLEQLEKDNVDSQNFIRDFIFTVIGNKIEELKGV